jgi:hypothetical protein
MWLAVLAAGAPAGALAAQGVIVDPSGPSTNLGQTGAAVTGVSGAGGLSGTSLGGTSIGKTLLVTGYHGASNAGQSHSGPQVSLATAVDGAFDEAIERLPIVDKMRWARWGRL